MSWFWGKSTTSQGDGKDDTGKGTGEGDPLRKLDPRLKNYLATEAPSNYNALANAEPTPQALPYRKQAPVSATSQPWAETGVPQQSLYQDGRYKELWKTYKPLEEIENATKTDQDRLLDIVAGLKERKTQISRAALENCSFEQTLVSDCFTFGGWKSRMTMCRAENKRFERCYVTQAVGTGFFNALDLHMFMDAVAKFSANGLLSRGTRNSSKRWDICPRTSVLQKWTNTYRCTRTDCTIRC